MPPAASFVGGAACVDCHAEAAEAFAGSHHDLAMQAAGPDSVLGDFDAAEFRYGDVLTRFSRRDGRFFVTTDNAEGEIEEFEIVYSFGVEPLQQYLVELGDGRLQALSIAWDSRPAAAGGQRWFHLYPGEPIAAGDPLHWTGLYQNWNTMCADCHSTDLVKAYDREADRFATRYTSVDVDCEACHGPGSVHAADPAIPPPALAQSEHTWVFDAGAAIASRRPAARIGAAPPPGFGDEIAVCARCHSRRTQLTDAHAAGDPLLDGIRPERLIEGLFHADGQILDEVYVYASFLQSAMARAGVVCSDCHEPHTAELRAEGNALCAQCHLATVYDQPAHHRHEAETAAAECTACHMRAETYMVVDPRRDHSFRVPRPALSAAIGSPDACSDCHAEAGPDWAAARVAEWFPDGRRNEPHFGQALAAARNWAADGRAALLELIADETAPGIARATAVELLAERMAPADIELIRGLLDGDEPLVMLAAVESVAGLEPARRVDLLQRFLTHERLALRAAAARSLLTARLELSERRQADLAAALEDYLAIQTFNSDRPEGLLNAANVAADSGRDAEAEQLYRDGIDRYPFAAALYVNLADLYRRTGQAEAAAATLREGMMVNPDDPALELALAFALVRQGQAEAAMPYFEAAAELAPDEPYYQYVLAIAENDAGDAAAALEILQRTHERFPGYPDALFALATLLRDTGEIAAAAEHARRLAELLPGDNAAVSLLRALEQQL